MASELQKKSVDENRKGILFAKQQAEAQNIVDQSKADIDKELASRTIESELKAPEAPTAPTQSAPAKPKSSLTDLILPLMGAVAGGMFMGPMGAVAGMGMGSSKSMSLKNDREKTVSQVQGDKDALDLEKWFKEQTVKNQVFDNDLNLKKLSDEKTQFNKMLEILGMMPTSQTTTDPQPTRIPVDLTGGA